MQDLLDPNDPDWKAFQDKDPDWFLKVAGDAIRDYCGWHIWPNIAVLDAQIPIGSKGIIMLPSRYVTDVVGVTIFPNSDSPMLLNPDTDYLWDVEGWIERLGASQDGVAAYYYGYGPAYLPVWQAGMASVSFNHGYELVPTPIKEIAYELATSTTEMPSGNIKLIATPGYKLQPGSDFGANLSTNQRTRLSRYRIGGVI